MCIPVHSSPSSHYDGMVFSYRKNLRDGGANSCYPEYPQYQRFYSTWTCWLYFQNSGYTNIAWMIPLRQMLSGWFQHCLIVKVPVIASEMSSSLFSSFSSFSFYFFILHFLSSLSKSFSHPQTLFPQRILPSPSLLSYPPSSHFSLRYFS